MRGFLRRRPAPATVLAFLALMVALGPQAVAAVSKLVTGAQIKNGSVTGSDVKNGSLRSADVRDGSLRAKDFRADELPAGAKGDKGDKGDQGLQGVAGKDGSDGTDGTDGTDGADGEPGISAYSARINDIPGFPYDDTPASRTLYAPIQGISTGAESRADLELLSPSRPMVAQKFQFVTSEASSPFRRRAVTLEVNGVASALTCLDQGEGADYVCATDASVAIPASSRLSLKVFYEKTAGLQNAPDWDALVTFELTNP